MVTLLTVLRYLFKLHTKFLYKKTNQIVENQSLQTMVLMRGVMVNYKIRVTTNLYISLKVEMS